MEGEQNNTWLVLFGGEAPRSLPACLKKNNYQGMICADSGANHAFDLQMIPDLIVGDLDSIDQEAEVYFTEKGVEFLKFPQEKDYTDGELAVIEAAKRGADHLLVWGVFGGRPDHELANIFLLSQYAHLFRSLTIWGEGFIAFFCPPGRAIKIKGHVGDIVSLLPLSPVVVKVRLEGFVYPLNQDDLTFGTTRGLSNCLAQAEGTVSHEGGRLMIIHYLGEALPGSDYGEGF